MAWLRSVARSRWLRAAAVAFAVGWGPLLLYVLWEALSGHTGGNPIGLGLLMLASTPLIAVLALVGIVQGTVRHLRA